MCRTAGFPRPISLNSFRQPNFPLVAELLEWIVLRFEPGALISTKTASEQERVIFIKSVVLLLLQNARLKLNPRKLYMADGHAVQELLAPLRILATADRRDSAEAKQTPLPVIRTRLATKFQEVRQCSQLAAQLPQTGSALASLLDKELFFRSARTKAISRALPPSAAEAALKSATAAIASQAAQTEARLNNVTSDERALDEKIERKRREHEQLQKRLAKLQYMDEYEKYEARLKDLYDVYVLKFRNLAFLQLQMAETERADRAKQQQTEASMRQVGVRTAPMHAQVVERMRTENAAHAPPIDMTELEDEMDAMRRESAGPRVFGNMMGAGFSDDDDDDDDDEEVEEEEEDDEDEEREVLVTRPIRSARLQSERRVSIARGHQSIDTDPGKADPDEQLLGDDEDDEQAKGADSGDDF